MFYCVAKKATETLYWCQMLKLAPSPPQKKKKRNEFIAKCRFIYMVCPLMREREQKKSNFSFSKVYLWKCPLKGMGTEMKSLTGK